MGAELIEFLQVIFFRLDPWRNSTGLPSGKRKQKGPFKRSEWRMSHTGWDLEVITSLPMSQEDTRKEVEF